MKRFIFIFYHFFIPFVLYFLAIKINYPYGYILFILPLSIVILIDTLAFSYHVRKYPLNKREEYAFKVRKADIADFENNIFVIKFKKEKNLYISTSGSKTLKFDMTNCILPKTVIRAYFIKKFNLIMYNRLKKPISKLGSSAKMPKCFKYPNLVIEFRYDNKIKKYYLIKDFKTKPNQLISEIIAAPFATYPLAHTSLLQHKHIDENI